MQLGKILFLGGAPFQVPIIKKANEMRFTTICVDNRKNNPGHKIAKKSYIESTINKLEILEIAKTEQISGIISYGSDVALKTQAFVCKNLGLFGPTIESVNILTNKHSPFEGQKMSYVIDFGEADVSCQNPFDKRSPIILLKKEIVI